MYTVNNWVAVTPFESVGVKTKHVPGLALMEHTTTLTTLEVVYPCEWTQATGTLRPGDIVYVKGVVSKEQWGDVYEVDGKRFILIPRSAIVGVKQVADVK